MAATMETARVLKLVHLVSEQCSFDREAQRRNWGKVNEVMARLDGVEEGLREVEGLLNGSRLSAFASKEDDKGDVHGDVPWLVLRLAGSEFENMVGLSLLVTMILVLLAVCQLTVWVGQKCRRQRMTKGVAQVTST